MPSISIGAQGLDVFKLPASAFCFDGEGVLTARGARAKGCLDGEGAGARDADGFEDGGWFSASDDCGDVGRGETAPLACLLGVLVSFGPSSWISEVRDSLRLFENCFS